MLRKSSKFMKPFLCEQNNLASLTPSGLTCQTFGKIQHMKVLLIYRYVCVCVIMGMQTISYSQFLEIISHYKIWDFSFLVFSEATEWINPAKYLVCTINTRRHLQVCETTQHNVFNKIKLIAMCSDLQILWKFTLNNRQFVEDFHEHNIFEAQLVDGIV